jgi:glucosamine-6-phosphate deaminase
MADFSWEAVVERQRFGRMAVHVGKDVAEMARAAAREAAAALSAALEARGEASAMFATGNSQLAFLDALVGWPGLDWSGVRIFHLDEYVGLGEDHPASFRRYVKERIADRVGPKEAHYLDGLAPPEAECRRYAELLKRYPLDLCVLGVGENGHLAFNDPPWADFHDPLDVKQVTLAEASRRQQVGEGHFADLEEVPEQALTVTIPAALRASRVVVVVPERRKAEAVRAALTGPVSSSCPASILRTRPNASMFLDRESAALLPAARA